ncbi:capsid protein [robinz virus RP_429]|nr:capsid protein [robinz virus RP_429]
MAMRSRGRRSFRKKFRRRFRKRRTPFRRRKFTRAVKRVILRTAEAKKVDNIQNGVLTTREGDGTTRTIWAIQPAAFLTQGTQADQFIGDKFWLKGFGLRGMAGLSGEVTNYAGTIIRVTLLHHFTNNNSTAASSFQEFTSATTLTSNPTQLAPFQNPQFFESTSTNQSIVGNGFTIPFDRKLVKVMATRTFAVNPGADNQAGEGVTAIPTPFKFYFPINKWVQIVDPGEGDLSSATLRFKHGSYWIVIQAVSNTNDNTNSPNAEIEHRLTTYFRDP